MDKQGFRIMLFELRQPMKDIAASLALAERFEAFLEGRKADAESAWAFSKVLIEEGNNTEENYTALIRYCLFVWNHAMYLAFLELVEGVVAGDDPCRPVAERFGAAIRDELFLGIGSTLSRMPAPDGPMALPPAIELLEVKVDK